MTPIERLIQELERTRDETVRYFSLGADALAKRSAPEKWPVRFLLHHLADSETVLLYRVRRVISEPQQVIWVYDQEAWAHGLDYEHLPLALSRSLYEPARAAIIYYARQHYEQSGARPFVHSVTGLRTLKDEFDKVADHNEQHLKQIRSALAA